MHDYFILATTNEPEHCAIGPLPEQLARQKWRIAKGQPMGEHHPARARLDMDKRYPGFVVPDLVSNTFHLYIISHRLKPLLQAELKDQAEGEFLPVSIYNHKGRVAEEDYSIANIFRAVECVDRSRSEFTESALKPGQLSILKRLQLDPERIPAEPRIFRLKEMPALLIIRGDLRARLEEAGITGANYVGLGDKCMFV
ncbi:imm11 family protein [Corallococcus terminator]